MAQLTAEQRKQLEHALDASERELLATIARVRAELATPPGITGPEVRDSGEDSQVRMANTQELVELDRAERQLGETSAALLRMRQGAYGDCEECGEDIPFERLRLRPTARFCVPHEAEREKRVAAGRA